VNKGKGRYPSLYDPYNGGLRGTKTISNSVTRKEYNAGLGSHAKYKLSGGDCDSEPLGPTKSLVLKFEDGCGRVDGNGDTAVATELDSNTYLR
jgi:hypothetical protein